jgi:undecaprenyl diphosphate synthase
MPVITKRAAQAFESENDVSSAIATSDVVVAVPLNTSTAGRVGPDHVAIIMDGNGRWAKSRGLPRIAGHREGSRAVRRVVEAAIRSGVSWLTI